MKRLYLLDLLALAATLAFAGCGKDDQTSDPAPSEPGLVIEQTDYTLDGNGLVHRFGRLDPHGQV